jgi:glucokinase
MGDLLLAGDIGGTKADLMVLSGDASASRVIAETRMPSREHGSFLSLLEAFMSTLDVVVTRASFSVAGPVVNGQVRLPNLGWTFGADEVRRALNLESLVLVNDLQATARAIPNLQPSQLLTLQAGRPVEGGARAVIAPGTGLGEALLIRVGGEYVPLATEGGHTDFAPADQEQRELLAFLQAEQGHVSWESVCSGKGISNLYRFLRVSGRATEPGATAALIDAAEDATRAIVDAGLSGADPASASARALELFTTILAAQAGNLALRGLTTGGLYIGGGLPPRLRDLIGREGFLRAFRFKGLMADLVRSIPLHLILEPRTALWGAVRYGFAPAGQPRYLAPVPDV